MIFPWYSHEIPWNHHVSWHCSRRYTFSPCPASRPKHVTRAMLTPRPEKRAFVDEITLDSWASWIRDLGRFFMGHSWDILRLSWRYHNKKGSWDIMECNVLHCKVMAWDIWGVSENGPQSSPWVSMLSHGLWLGWFEVPWSSYLLPMKEQSYFGISNHIIISVRGSSDHSNRHSQYFAV